MPGRHAAGPAFSGHAGERAISTSVTATQALFWRTCAVARGNPCLGTSTVRASKAGFEPAFSSGRSIRHPHHQRRLSRCRHCERSEAIHRAAKRIDGLLRRFSPRNDGIARQTVFRKFLLRREMRRDFADSSKSALSSVSGSSPRSLRQAPRAWARAYPREPRDPGLPFRLSPAISSISRAASVRTTKNPPEHRAREGSHRSELSISASRDRLHEPGMRYRSAQNRTSVGRAFRVRGSSSDSCCFANPVFARAREIRLSNCKVKQTTLRNFDGACNKVARHHLNTCPTRKPKR
jgi:hypothetical protein